MQIRIPAVVLLVGLTSCSDSTDAGDAGAPPGADAVALDGGARDTTVVDVGDDGEADLGPFRLQWAKMLNGAGCYPGHPVALAPLDDNGFIFGGTCGRIEFPGVSAPAGEDGWLAVARFDGQGLPMWLHRFGDLDQSQWLSTLATDGQNIMIGGMFVGSLAFGGWPFQTDPQDDLFVARLDGAGRHVWSHQFGGTAREEIHSLSFLANGGAILAGLHEHRGDTRFGKVTLNSTSGCLTDRYITKLAADGETDSAECFVEVERAVANAAGDVFVAEGAQAAKLAPPGVSTRAWAHAFDGFMWRLDQVSALALDAAGDLVLTGRIGGFMPHEMGNFSGDGFDLLAAKLRADGTVVFQHRIPSVGDGNEFRIPEARGQSLAVGPDGDVWIGGLFAGAIDFGGASMVGGNSDDIGFVVHFGANGELLHSLKFGAPVEAIVRSQDGSITVAGKFTGVLRIGNTTLEAPTIGSRVFIARLMP